LTDRWAEDYCPPHLFKLGTDDTAARREAPDAVPHAGHGVGAGMPHEVPHRDGHVRVMVEFGGR